MIDMIPVTSSNIAAIGYDRMSNILQIEFISGSVYQYYGVPLHIFEELMNADSKGGYANQNIYRDYNYSKQR